MFANLFHFQEVTEELFERVKLRLMKAGRIGYRSVRTEDSDVRFRRGTDPVSWRGRIEFRFFDEINGELFCYSR